MNLNFQNNNNSNIIKIVDPSVSLPVGHEVDFRRTLTQIATFEDMDDAEKIDVIFWTRNTLETSGEDVNTTLETSGEDVKYTQNEWGRCKTTLKRSGKGHFKEFVEWYLDHYVPAVIDGAEPAIDPEE